MRNYRQTTSFWLTSQALCFCLLLQGSGIAQALPLPSRWMPALLAAPSGQGGLLSPPDLGKRPIDATPPAEIASLVQKSGTGDIPLLAGLNLVSTGS